MAFPFIPDGPPDSRGLYLCQSPGLTSRVMPLFRFDPGDPGRRPEGHGTAFRIDSWSRCLTAYHVLEDLFELNEAAQLRLRPDIRIAALDVPALGYGQLRVPDGAWRPVVECFTHGAVHTPPLREAELRNFCEMVVLRIRPREMPSDGTPWLPVQLSGWSPRIGETMMALGYADLDKADGGPENRAIEQRLWGSFGQITDIHAADPGSGRPWPQIRVDADWPGGMSGGPVFNEDGHVVGLVSAGFRGEGGASATFFSGWDIPRRMLGTLDPANPGWFRCHAVFGGDGEPAYCGQVEAEARGFAEKAGLSDIGTVSICLETGEFVRL